MQSDIYHSDSNGAKEATESSQLATSLSAPNRLARLSFLRRLGLGAALLAPGAALLSGSGKALAANGSQSQTLTPGDVAILRLLAAAELIEADLWKQYNELGGIGVTGSISQPYITDLQVLDGDMPQYIADNTDDENSHVAFLNAYLASKGEEQVNFDAFRNIPPSKVTGVPQTGRLTNLQQLSVDTSWWIRYRSTTNPDLGAVFTQQAVQGLNVGQHPAIPGKQCRPQLRQPPPGDRLHGRISLWIYRAGRHQALRHPQPAGN